jgi:hypothetical protein
MEKKNFHIGTILSRSPLLALTISSLPLRPNPSIDDLEDASLQFCDIPWNEIYSSHQNNSHQMTNDDKLPNRCVEALYITTLLEDGFGFRGTHRGITLALEVDGTEVEWTLGFALAEELLESLHSNSFTSSSPDDQQKEEEEQISSEPSSSDQSTNETETGSPEEEQERDMSEEEKEERKMNGSLLKSYAAKTKFFVTQRMKSFLKLWSQFSVAKVSSLIVNVLKALINRIHFTTDLFVIKPTQFLIQTLIQFFVKFQHNLHDVARLIHQKLPPSLVRILPFPRGVKSSQNSTIPTSPS